MFEWKQTYSVGISSVDAQHQNLFATAHELYDAMSAGQGKAALSRILERLVQYTSVHFAHEERLMRQSHYPGIERHQQEHAELTLRVLKFQEELRSGRATVTVQVLHFLKAWLENHILGSDQAYAAHMKGQASVLTATS